MTKAKFVVSPRAQNEYKILGGVRPFGADKIAREALAKARHMNKESDEVTPTLDEAWTIVDVLCQEHYPGISFGVAIDGPGYVAWVGGEYRIIDAWSVNDFEMVGNDIDVPSSPTRALLRLAEKIKMRGEKQG